MSAGTNGTPRPETPPVDETTIVAHFTTLFGSRRGYIGILSGERNGKKLKDATDRAYPWPASKLALAGYVAQEVAAGREIYSCGHLLTRQRRIKENAAPMGVLYVDGDGATLPATVPPPTYTVHSSPGREQWYWHLTVDVDPERGEQLNRRLAYAIGADKGGWDLTQALRIPGTPNRKYDGLPIVRAEQPTGATYDPDELDRLLPPAPSVAPRPGTVRDGPGDDADDEPPVELDAAGLAVWRGERRKVKPDGSGEIDRSDTLWWLACELREAGATQRTIATAAAERDATWGWGCYADRPGEYDRLAAKVVAKITPGPRSAPTDQPTTNHPPTDQTDQPTDPCASVRDELASLRRRIAELEAENAKLRLENTRIINTVINPSLKAEAPTIVRTVVRAAAARQRGDTDEQGFVRVNEREIGDDWEHTDGKPIRNRATVKRHLERAAQMGLLERDVRPAMVPRIVRDTEGQPVLDPATGKPKTEQVAIRQTWVKLTGDSVADMLKPFASFRAPDRQPDDTPPKRHGGDRRSADFRASRTPCPDCGSTNRVTYCAGCGVDITATAEADERQFHDETRQRPTSPAAEASAFQDEAVKNATPPVVQRIPFQDETRSRRCPVEPAHLAVAPEPAPPDIVGSAGYLPGFGALPRAPLDHRTDVAYGARR